MQSGWKTQSQTVNHKFQLKGQPPLSHKKVLPRKTFSQYCQGFRFFFFFPRRSLKPGWLCEILGLFYYWQLIGIMITKPCASQTRRIVSGCGPWATFGLQASFETAELNDSWSALFHECLSTALLRSTDFPFFLWFLNLPVRGSGPQTPEACFHLSA